MKRDQYYPFKKGDEIQIIKEEGNGYVELKSSKKNTSVKLNFSLTKKVYRSCFSSEVVKNKIHRSINYLIAVQDIKGQKWNLFEYRIRWVVDIYENFFHWEEPQLLGDSKCFGLQLDEIQPFLPTSEKIEGVLFKCKNGDFITSDFSKFDYEF